MERTPAPTGNVELPAAKAEHRHAAGSGQHTSDAAGAPTAPQIEAWLVSHIAELMGFAVSEIDADKEFTYYGLDSAESVLLAGDLEEWLGRPLAATVAFEYPTIASLARHLSALGDSPDPDS